MTPPDFLDLLQELSLLASSRRPDLSSVADFCGFNPGTPCNRKSVAEKAWPQIKKHTDQTIRSLWMDRLPAIAEIPHLSDCPFSGRWKNAGMAGAREEAFRQTALLRCWLSRDSNRQRLFDANVRILAAGFAFLDKADRQVVYSTGQHGLIYLPFYQIVDGIPAFDPLDRLKHDVLAAIRVTTQGQIPNYLQILNQQDDVEGHAKRSTFERHNGVILAPDGEISCFALNAFFREVSILQGRAPFTSVETLRDWILRNYSTALISLPIDVNDKEREQVARLLKSEHPFPQHAYARSHGFSRPTDYDYVGKIFDDANVEGHPVAKYIASLRENSAQSLKITLKSYLQYLGLLDLKQRSTARMESLVSWLRGYSANAREDMFRVPVIERLFSGSEGFAEQINAGTGVTDKRIAVFLSRLAFAFNFSCTPGGSPDQKVSADDSWHNATRTTFLGHTFGRAGSYAPSCWLALPIQAERGSQPARTTSARFQEVGFMLCLVDASERKILGDVFSFDPFSPTWNKQSITTNERASTIRHELGKILTIGRLLGKVESDKVYWLEIIRDEQLRSVFRQLASEALLETDESLDEPSRQRAGEAALINLKAKPDVVLVDYSEDEIPVKPDNALGMFRYHLLNLPDPSGLRSLADPQEAGAAAAANPDPLGFPQQMASSREAGDEERKKLLPIVEYELDRLSRSLAAVIVDASKNGAPSAREIKQLLSTAKDSLPIFVPLPHQIDRLDLLLWPTIWTREFQRYALPPRALPTGEFLTGETPETARHRKEFLQRFKLTESDLRPGQPHHVIQLLRALVPKAESVEILVILDGGLSGAEAPFIVRGKTSQGAWLRPVQIKLSEDWRGLARERKGYHDVFRSRLGPAIAHTVEGPYRKGQWTGMAQSFAAPEQALTDISSKRTRTLRDWLEESLGKPENCRRLVDSIFDGVLAPFYGENLVKKTDVVHRVFSRVSPAHCEIAFEPSVGDETVDFSPEALSSNHKSRCEEAFIRWRQVEHALLAKTMKGSSAARTIRGLVIDSLKVDKINPMNCRLRLIDSTLGVKVDLYPRKGDYETASQWTALADSPIKLRGLPVEFRASSDNERLINVLVTGDRLFRGWGRAIASLLRESGILPGGISDKPDDAREGRTNRVWNYFYPWHPLDWSETFTIGPIHGDLNLGNILLHQEGDGFFPWLIDFDQAQNEEPIAFDLSKLEIEAYHNVGYRLFVDLERHGIIYSDETLDQAVQDFERCLESDSTASVDHLWSPASTDKTRGEVPPVPYELRTRFNGFLAYLKRVRERVRALGVSDHEFLLARAGYCMACLKFGHLYRANTEDDGLFRARILLYKLQCLLNALDRSDGVTLRDDEPQNTRSTRERVTSEIVQAVRRHGISLHDAPPFVDLISAVKEIDLLSQDFPYNGDPKLILNEAGRPNRLKAMEVCLRLLRDDHVNGSRRWFREVLWYIREHGAAGQSEQDMAIFIWAIVLASTHPNSWLQIKTSINPELKDYASTGRLANAYPTQSFLRHLRDANLPFIKISSRGESGGTIDILEDVGIDICRSAEAVQARVTDPDPNNQWVVAETSTQLCEIDNIMMTMRRDCRCMKVEDLVIASISAKKLAVGIANFDVQLVEGYDAKFRGNLETVKARWQRIWQQTCPYGNVVATAHFNSDTMSSWLDELETLRSANSRANDLGEVIICGNALLGAQIWALLGDKGRLPQRLGDKFTARMNRLADDLAKLLEELRLLKGATRILQTNLPFRADVSVSCYRKDSFEALNGALAGMAALVFRFSPNVFDYRIANNGKWLRIPYFDALFGDLKRSGHPLATVIFAGAWLAILCPLSIMRADVFRWAWEILREGFDVWDRNHAGAVLEARDS